jgi:hypothetical protein
MERELRKALDMYPATAFVLAAVRLYPGRTLNQIFEETQLTFKEVVEGITLLVFLGYIRPLLKRGRTIYWPNDLDVDLPGEWAETEARKWSRQRT